MIGLSLFAALIFGAVCVVTSAGIGASLGSSERRLAGVAPRTRARLLGMALWAPPLLGLAVLAAVLAPHTSFGLPDHCLDHPDHHLHLCLQHGAPMPQLLLSLLGLGGLAALALRLGGALGSIVKAERSARALRRSGRDHEDLLVLPEAAPVAFTAGLLRPRVFVSEGVLAEPERWAAVLEHERSHRSRRDPLRRALARLGAAFHLPGVGRRLVAALEEEQELAADEAAARALGDRVRVAEALLDWARSCRVAERAALGAWVGARFGAEPLRRRVLALMAEEPAATRPPWWLDGAFVLALCAPLACAPGLHHAIETFLGLWGHP